MLDPYDTLEVGRDATLEEIKQAFRRLAKALHPDVNQNNPLRTRRFKAVTEAYDVLCDESKRRQYDRESAASRQRAKAAAEAKVKAGAGAQGDDGLDAFFRNRGSGNPRQERAADGFLRGADLHHTLTLPFLEAALGTKRRITLSDRRSIEVTVPPLTQDGQVLRFKGQGAQGTFGGPAGDLLVDVMVEPHAVFTRKNQDIYMNLAVTVPEAVLGAVILVPTVQGSVQLKIPKGSNTDTLLRLKSMGLPMPQGGQGDHYVTLKVIMPPETDTEFPKLVETWAKRKPYRVRPISS
jgi:DnaJ-class molecular chaperone